MGRILFGGTAALLICIFLSPRFIEFLREREFGQHIREDGPAGHHQKAGTPTMGGIIIFLAVSVAFLILTNYESRSGCGTSPRTPRTCRRRCGCASSTTTSTSARSTRC